MFVRNAIVGITDAGKQARTGPLGFAKTFLTPSNLALLARIALPTALEQRRRTVAQLLEART